MLYPRPYGRGFCFVMYTWEMAVCNYALDICNGVNRQTAVIKLDAAVVRAAGLNQDVGSCVFFVENRPVFSSALLPFSFQFFRWIRVNKLLPLRDEWCIFWGGKKNCPG